MNSWKTRIQEKLSYFQKTIEFIVNEYHNAENASISFEYHYPIVNFPKKTLLIVDYMLWDT
jgi:hypothetical protein